MLALITQTKVQRAWIQLGTGSGIPLALKPSDEEKATPTELSAAEEFQVETESTVLSVKTDLELPVETELPTLSELQSQIELPGLPTKTELPKHPILQEQSELPELSAQKALPTLSEFQSQTDLPGLAKQIELPALSTQTELQLFPDLLTLPSQTELPELSSQTELPALPELKTPIKSCQRKKSKIPRMIRPANNQPKEPRQANEVVINRQPVATISTPLVVRSTRTSRCRIKLAHPEWEDTQEDSPHPLSSSPSVSCCSKRDVSEPQNAVGGKRKRLTEPQTSTIVIEISDRLQNGHKQRLWRLKCCDQKQIHVPSQLINRYSVALSEREREPSFSFSRAIYLDSISSLTVLRVVQWMQHHCNEDISQLSKTLPSLHNAQSTDCTWDERFLGVELEPVLQLLLAARVLGINPLMEHTMLYFMQLIEQRPNAQSTAVAAAAAGDDQLQMQLQLQLALDNVTETDATSELPQTVADDEDGSTVEVEFK